MENINHYLYNPITNYYSGPLKKDDWRHRLNHKEAGNA